MEQELSAKLSELDKLHSEFNSMQAEITQKSGVIHEQHGELAEKQVRFNFSSRTKSTISKIFLCTTTKPR